VGKHQWGLRSLILVLATIAVAIVAHAEPTLPAEELQVNLSAYVDSFNVVVLYPGISTTREVAKNTAVTGGVLIDMISAASIQSNSVDVVTSASGQSQVKPVFDDVRKQVTAGVVQSFLGNLFSANGIYSTETDYQSKTITANVSREFAQKNATLQLGLVHSWDDVAPVTKPRSFKRSTSTYSANLSQVLSKRALLQLVASYTKNSGYLSDAYKLVGVRNSRGLIENLDPIHPSSRTRKAGAARLKLRLSPLSSLLVGYRYYRDDWDVHSHTASTAYKRYLAPFLMFTAGFRAYSQSRAYFFKRKYEVAEPLMTADITLDRLWSSEVQLDLAIDGGEGRDYLPFLTDDKIQYVLGVGLYHRRTATGYWFNGLYALNALNMNITLGGGDA